MEDCTSQKADVATLPELFQQIRLRWLLIWHHPTPEIVRLAMEKD